MGMTWGRAWGALVVAGLLALCGCRYQVAKGVAEHIRTVEVNMFRNDTFSQGLEGELTQAIIDEINLVPGLQVVNSGGDAVLHGEILKVLNIPYLSDVKGRPYAFQIHVVSEFSLEDSETGVVLIDQRKVASSRSSGSAGRYDVNRDESRGSAEASAVRALAKDMVEIMLDQDW